MKEFEKISAEELERVMKLSDDELAKVGGGTNWQEFGRCMIENGSSDIPELAEITLKIQMGDLNTVKIMAKQAAIAALPITSRCLASS